MRSSLAVQIIDFKITVAVYLNCAIVATSLNWYAPCYQLVNKRFNAFANICLCCIYGSIPHITSRIIASVSLI